MRLGRRRRVECGAGTDAESVLGLVTCCCAAFFDVCFSLHLTHGNSRCTTNLSAHTVNSTANVTKFQRRSKKQQSNKRDGCLAPVLAGLLSYPCRSRRGCARFPHSQLPQPKATESAHLRSGPSCQHRARRGCVPLPHFPVPPPRATESTRC